jgi:hypothetical protein
MKLADQVAQFRTPFLLQDSTTKAVIHLNNAAECAVQIAQAPIRYVLSDELTRLCTALAYSKGARTLACADLLRVPAEAVWIEWCSEPWEQELKRYGFPPPDVPSTRGARRGALLRASRDGRRGMLRTFWSGDAPEDVLASSIEGYFDFDTAEGEDPQPPPGELASTGRVRANAVEADDMLHRCFRFRYERTWDLYYQRAALNREQREALWRHALGTIVIDIPVVMGFFLLLATRSSLPQRPQSFERLNRSRLKAGKPALLEHIDVTAPILPGYARWGAEEPVGVRRSPKLHHVRGHLVRRGSQLFWRIPHLRGCAALGSVRTRTVTWTVGGALCHGC